jgi:PBSX family phage terminase large subunit
MAKRPRRQRSKFTFLKFSTRQKQLLTWWKPGSPYADYDTVIATGSIRSGKTIADIISFTLWSNKCYSGQNFILAAKSMGALHRNVISPMLQILNALGLDYDYIRSGPDAHIRIGTNTYYLFGANNEASQDTLQGLTAAGAYLDDAGKIPKSFLDQANARCSVHGAKLWLNVNPEGPAHHIKNEWIDKAHEKRILVLQFGLDDNLTLSPKTKAKYRRMYSGVFYQRNILGLWVMAEGLVYPMFDESIMVVDELPSITQYWVGVDYGASNATTFLLFGLGVDNKLYLIDEYYHSYGESGIPKSPSRYSADFQQWMAGHAGITPKWIFIDPSALGFIQQLFSDGVKGIAKADNRVKEGIELTSSVIANGYLRILRRCVNTIKEFGSYAWDTKAQERGEDVPMKANDHCMDPLRYVVNGTSMLWYKLGIARKAP